MSQVNYGPLEFATELLKARLAQQLPLGVNIIPPGTAEAPANLNDHPGNFVGFFFWLANGDPSFVWLSRNLPPPLGISHVHIHYINQQNTSVPAEDVKRFASKRLALHTKYCAVNLIAKIPKFLSLSALIQALEVTLKSGRLELEQTHRIGLAINCYLNGDPDAPRPSVVCERYEAGDDSLVKSMVKRMGYNWVEIDPYDSPIAISPDFDVIQVRTTSEGLCRRHLVYGIHYKQIKVVMLLICHPYIFHDKAHREPVTNAILRSLGNYKLKFIGASRYYKAGAQVLCNSDEVVKACLLALQQPLVVIKSSDVEHFYDDDYFYRRLETFGASSQLSSVLLSTQMSDPGVDESSIHDWISCTPLGESELSRPGTANMSIASSVVSTQAINTFNPRDVRRAINNFNSQSQFRGELSEMLIPPIVRVDPYDDIKKDFLHSNDLFINCLRSYVNLWRTYVSVAVLDPIYLIQACDSRMFTCDSLVHRFVIQPVLYSDHVLVLILDNQERDLAYINPYFGEETPFTPALGVLHREIPGINGKICRPIALTSYFHREFSKIHILMGLFHIGRLFKYARILPKRLSYLERDFRQLCWRLCYALQVANADYNLSQGLVNDNGYLLPGAKRSSGSPVTYAAAVVSRKECPFCLDRNWTKLGRHMIMKHGNQARVVRMARTQSEEIVISSESD